MQKLPTGGKDHPSNTNWQAPYIENVDETYEDDAGSSPQESCSGAPTTLSASEEVDPPIDVVAPTEPTVIPGQSTETPAGTTASPMPESIQNRRSTVPPAVSHQGPSVEDVDDPREGGAESKVQRSDSHAPTTHSASKEATPPGEALAPTESTVISGQPAEPPREAAATTESTIISGQPAEPPREAAAPSESTVIPGQPAETPKETAAPHTPESIQNRRSTVPPAIGHQDPSVEDIDETLEKGAESTQQRSDSRAPTTRPASTELDPLRKATTPAESTVISGQPAETTARPTASPTPESIQTHKSTVLPAVSHQDPSVEGIEETHKDGTEPTVQPSVNRAPTAHSASSIKVDPPREAAASAEPTVIPGQSAEAPAGTTASHTPESIQNQQSTVPPAISHQGPSVEGVDDPRDGGAESTVQRSDSHAPTTHSASKEANPPREALAPTESTVISGQPAEPPREAAAPTDSTVISGQPAEPSGESAAPPKPESTRNQSTVPRAVSHQGPSVEDIDEPHEDDAEPTVPGQPAETPGETAVPPKPESIQNQPSTVPPAIGHQGPSVEDVDETHKDGTEPTVQRSDNRAPTAHSASSIKVDPPREAAASAEPTVIPGQSAETPAGTTASHTPEPIQTHQSTVPRAVSHQGPSVEDIDEPHEDDAEPTVQRSDKRPPTTHSASKEANPPREAAAPAESTIIPDQPAEPSGGSAAPPKPESIQIPRSPTPPGHNRPNQPACPRDAGKGAGTDQSPSIGVNKPKSPKVQKPKQLLGKRRRGTAPESWVPKRPCIESPKAQQRGLMNWARDRQRKVPASLDGSRLYGPRTVAFVAEFAAFVRNLAASADAHIASDAVPQANGDHMGSSLPAANTEATQRTPLHGNIPRDEASPGSAEQHRMLESMYVFGTAEMSFDTTHPQPLSQHPNTAPASDVHPVLSEEPSITIQSTDSLGSKPTEDLAAQTLDTEQTVQQSGDTSFCGTGPNEDSSAQAPHIVTQEASQDLDCDQPMQEPAPNQRMPVHDESRTESPSLSAQRPKLATYIPPVEVSSTPSSPVVFPAPTTRESAPNPDISVSESANSVDLIQDLNGAQQNGTGQHLNTFIKSKKKKCYGDRGQVRLFDYEPMHVTRGYPAASNE
ncbi:hypothetical protein N7523_005838 [Penicillium sp. IBT 18751x]|nr:hypothetical protein N7523_005838 [Penicillium sp. IBT 18751x]